MRLGIINAGGLAPIIDVRTFSVRGAAVLGATIILWFAAKGIKSKKEE
jgi:hypothetical protein